MAHDLWVVLVDSLHVDLLDRPQVVPFLLQYRYELEKNLHNFIFYANINYLLIGIKFLNYLVYPSGPKV